MLNAADPDAPCGLDIARVVAGHLGHQWSEVALGDDVDPALGWHPWDRRYPVVLDTTASIRLGYQPVGDYQSTAGSVIDWLVRVAEQNGPARLPEQFDDGYLANRFDYDAEDHYLRSHPGLGPASSVCR